MDRTPRSYDPGQSVNIPVGSVTLEGNLSIPEGAEGLVVFAHGSGSSRFSPRNQFVARGLREGKLGTLLFDLLTPEEEKEDLITRRLRFDIDLLASRVTAAGDWLLQQAQTRSMNIGYFGSSTGAAAALIAAAQRPNTAGAVVSRGGRPDLAGKALPLVKAPTLLIVGGNDIPVIDMNREALAKLRTEKRLDIVPGATHLFEEPGTLEEVVRLAREWFQRHLSSAEKYRTAV